MLDEIRFELSWWGFSFEGSRMESMIAFNAMQSMVVCSEVA
jgi:hypothetical protein